MTAERFWMVWNNTSTGRPTFKHHSKADAEREAKRLAALNPSHTFFVMKTIAGFKSANRPVKQIKIVPPVSSDIPF